MGAKGSWIIIAGAVALGFLIALAFDRARAPQMSMPPPSTDSALTAPAPGTAAQRLGDTTGGNAASRRAPQGSPRAAEADSQPPTAAAAVAPSEPASSQTPNAHLREQSAPPTSADEPRRLEDVQLPAGSRGTDVLRNAEQQFAAESKDPLWSTTMEARILSEFSLAAAGLGFTNVNVDCRTTTCRLQTRPAATRPQPQGGRASSPPGDASNVASTIAEALDLKVRLVLAVLDGYGQPVTLAFLDRTQAQAQQ